MIVSALACCGSRRGHEFPFTTESGDLPASLSPQRNTGHADAILNHYRHRIPTSITTGVGRSRSGCDPLLVNAVIA